MLGPQLFIKYVNSISCGLVSQCMVFADDSKIFLHYSNRGRNGVLQHMIALQTEIDRISTTAASWNLHLNPDKCVVMRFYRGIKWECGKYKYFLNGARMKLYE